MTGAESLQGGIATANKNSLRATIKVAVALDRRLIVVSLLEPQKARPHYLPANAEFVGCDRSKLIFSRKLLIAALKGSWFIFDHVTLALPVLFFAAIGWCKTVIIAHGSEADDRMKRSSRCSFRAASLIISNSELTRKRLLRHLPQVDCRACLLGLNPDIPLRSGSSARSGDRIELVAVDGQKRHIGEQMLLLVARIDSSEMEKGHRQLILALPQLRRKFPTVQVVFPGGGSGRSVLERLAAEHQIADMVFLPGYVSNECLKSLYSTCYAFVMPSQQEGFGLVYLEAMNFSKSCVGCRNDGAEEVVVHESTGLLLNEQSNTSELTSALSRLLENPSWNKELGIQGNCRLNERFSAESHQDRFARMLGGVLEPKSQRSD